MRPGRPAAEPRRNETSQSVDCRSFRRGLLDGRSHRHGADIADIDAVESYQDDCFREHENARIQLHMMTKCSTCGKHGDWRCGPQSPGPVKTEHLTRGRSRVIGRCTTRTGGVDTMSEAGGGFSHVAMFSRSSSIVGRVLRGLTVSSRPTALRSAASLESQSPGSVHSRAPKVGRSMQVAASSCCGHGMSRLRSLRQLQEWTLPGDWLFQARGTSQRCWSRAYVRPRKTRPTIDELRAEHRKHVRKPPPASDMVSTPPVRVVHRPITRDRPRVKCSF